MKKVIAYIKNNKLHLAMWAVFLALVIILGSNGTLSKYSSKLNGTGSGTAARFDVSVAFTGEMTDFTLEDEDGKRTAEYKFAVTSKCEVPISYDVVITLKEALPEGVTFNIEDTQLTKSDNGLIYIFSNVGTFTSSGGTNNHILTITVSDFYTRVNHSGISVQVLAQQVE